jgi:hypothetical protein
MMRSLLCCLGFIALASQAFGEAPRAVEFNRDVRPILADHCYACHGPDKNQRKADLRLDTAEGAVAEREGTPAVVPGKPAESELVKRITEANPKHRMPPAKFGKPLSAKQIETLRLWVEQGAKYQKHWSLIAPPRPTPPEVGKDRRPANAIDRFVLARLEQEGLKPAPEADKRTLIRRLSFDLLGLPPAPEQVDAFLSDTAPDAYEKLVDRLLASRHYGERMALYWLDLVRYADTGGYHSDNEREITLYRDYVIAAFNENKPFDRFTVEQLAGDLLPNPNIETRVASGYNRLLMTTEEGGSQAKEYTAKYAADRVRNVSVVWLGLTMGCCECHDHKFDPIVQKDFYRFASFFADVKERAVGRQEQDKLPTEEQLRQFKTIDEQTAAVQKELATANLDAAQAEWEKKLEDKDRKALPKEIAAILGLPAEERNDKHKQMLATYFRGIAPQLAEERKKLADLQKQKQDLERTVPQSLVTTAVAPRMMRVLPRGNWLDDSGEIVAPGVPASLSPLNVGDRRATRLDLAQWMTAADNPLVARVFVNRVWKLLFGQGVVKSLDDFGAQGTWPTHPELLDWLAVEFRESGWDVKKLVKLMVMSNTYRQSSLTSEALRHRDPYNLLLARQARFRIDAEMVRDNALAVSGLLVRTVGGPSARPYQPAGYWALLNFPKREYQNDHGEGQYRRGLYTFWCRTFPHPSLTTFDAPSREECTVERPRSNTPLQALVLLNDPSYVEAARALAERMIRDGGNEAENRIQFAYRQVLCRKASPEEAKLVEGLYRKHLAQFSANKADAVALLTVGDRPAPKDVEAAELAAWTSVARVLLNLHETITRN